METVKEYTRDKLLKFVEDITLFHALNESLVLYSFDKEDKTKVKDLKKMWKNDILVTPTNKDYTLFEFMEYLDDLYISELRKKSKELTDLEICDTPKYKKFTTVTYHRFVHPYLQSLTKHQLLEHLSKLFGEQLVEIYVMYVRGNFNNFHKLLD